MMLFSYVFKFQVADYNVAAAQQGIVYIHEVDKITKKVLLGSCIHLSLPSFFGRAGVNLLSLKFALHFYEAGGEP